MATNNEELQFKQLTTRQTALIILISLLACLSISFVLYQAQLKHKDKATTAKPIIRKNILIKRPDTNHDESKISADQEHIYFNLSK